MKYTSEFLRTRHLDSESSVCFNGGMNTTPTQPTARQCDGYALEFAADGFEFDPDKRTVVQSHGWSFSTCSPIWNADGTITPGVKVSSFDSSTDPDPARWARNPDIDGKIFPTHEDAKREAFRLGILAHFIYQPKTRP